MNKKQKLINFIQKQLNITLENDKGNILNKKRNLLYTKIENIYKNVTLDFLLKNNINFEEHLGGYYWINCQNI